MWETTNSRQLHDLPPITISTCTTPHVRTCPSLVTRSERTSSGSTWHSPSCTLSWMSVLTCHAMSISGWSRGAETKKTCHMSYVIHDINIIRHRHSIERCGWAAGHETDLLRFRTDCHTRRIATPGETCACARAVNAHRALPDRRAIPYKW